MDNPSIVNKRLHSPNEWQIEEIRKGIDEADSGDFASGEELRQVLERWRKN